MIVWMIHYLEQIGMKIPSVFLYTSTRMMCAALTTLIVSIFFGPWFIGKLYALKVGQSIRKEECPHLGKLHEKKENTPTMGGGVLLLFGLPLTLHSENRYPLPVHCAAKANEPLPVR